jgi:hypothetical protein
VRGEKRFFFIGVGVEGAKVDSVTKAPLTRSEGGGMKTLLDRLIDHVVEVTDSDDLAIDSVKFRRVMDEDDLRSQMDWWSNAVKTEHGWESEA